MGLIPFWRFPSDAGTASASSTAGAGYAAANVQKSTLKKRWKSDAIEATAYHDTDFGSAVDAIGLWPIKYASDFSYGDSAEIVFPCCVYDFINVSFAVEFFTGNAFAISKS